MRKRILWVDDEIEFLRSHIVFLETRGYAVTSASGGDEAIRLIHESDPAFDIVLLDRQMPVKSGNATLDEIKSQWPDLPVIMLTGYQHGADITIKKKYDDYLTKPVDPNKLLQACKRIIEPKQQTSRRFSDGYLRDYTEIRARLSGASGASDWMDIYASLAKWDNEMDGIVSEGVRQAHTGLKSDCGKGFCDFVAENYAGWVKNKAGRPLMSVDMLEKAVVPELLKGKSVLMAVLSGMRLGQFLAVEPLLKRYFSVSRAKFVSALPTLSKICVPALASGRHPAAALELEPALFDPKGGGYDPAAMKRLMRGGLERAGVQKVKTLFTSADGAAGKRHIASTLEAVKKAQAFGIITLDVVGKFTAPAPAGRKQAAEAAHDDAALRERIGAWFAGSTIFSALREACGDACTVILTSDRGHISCNRASEIYEVQKIGPSLRCLFGDKAAGDDREVFLLEDLSHFGLPPQILGSKCLMARENFYFALHGRRVRQTSNNFQSGGMSLEEMVMPLYVCRPKNQNPLRK